MMGAAVGEKQADVPGWGVWLKLSELPIRVVVDNQVLAASVTYYENCKPARDLPVPVCQHVVPGVQRFGVAGPSSDTHWCTLVRNHNEQSGRVLEQSSVISWKEVSALQTLPLYLDWSHVPQSLRLAVQDFRRIGAWCCAGSIK